MVTGSIVAQTAPASAMSCDTCLNQANTLVRNGQHAEALSLLQGAVQAHPEFYLYHARLAELYLKKGQPEHAITAYGKAVALRPEIAWLRQALARIRPVRKFAGQYDAYPNLTQRRKAEGGQRMRGHLKHSRPMAPLVSIVTVVFNNPDSLQRCMDSVHRQTYSNVEYIVIDGGSDTPTLDVIRRNESFIDYFVSEPDGGIYSAMNKGITLARGDYICLLNSDDYYAPEFVEKAVTQALIGTQSADIVCTDFWASGRRHSAQPINSGIFFGHLNICHNTFLTSKECYDRIGPYNEEFRIVSDVIWTREAFLNGVKFRVLPEPLFCLSEGGVSSSSTEVLRKLRTRESLRSYGRIFPGISENDRKQIYQFRFGPQMAEAMYAIVLRYDAHPNVRDGLRNYVEHCVRDRPAFQLADSNPASGVFAKLLKLIELLDLERACLQTGNFHNLPS